jgi:glutaminyl-peptide cyclotransferase
MAARTIGTAIAILLAATVLPARATAQTPAFDSARAWTHLSTLVSHGPRPAGSVALQKNRDYIKQQLAAMGVAVAEQGWDDTTPAGRVRMVNLIATIPGARPDRLVFAGHYDTKRMPGFVGANDGASSAAFLLELARVLKARQNPLTMELLFLDGEEAVVEWSGEDHTYGSRHYVAEARRTGTLRSLKALMLVDMIGDRDLRIKRETNSTPWLTDAIWSAAARVPGAASVFVREATPIEDDHLEFLEAGVEAVDIIDLDYPYWHTPDDTVDKLSARSLQVVADVLLAAIPAIESRTAR